MQHFGSTLALFALALLVGCASTPQQVPTEAVALGAAFESPVAFVSAGDTLRGVIHVPEGTGLHSTVLFFSGFPGLAETPPFVAAVAGAGYNVLFFPYRGSYASDGTYSPDHALASAEAALAFLRSPEARTRYRVDSDDIALWGESFGAWVGLSLAAADPSVECIAAGIVANLGELGRRLVASEPIRTAIEENFRQTEANLPIRLDGGPQGFVSTIMNRIEDYDLVPLMPALSDRTVFMFGAEEDETVPLADHYQPVADALEATGMTGLTLVTAPGGHVDPSPERIEQLIQWLGDDCFGDQ